MRRTPILAIAALWCASCFYSVAELDRSSSGPSSGGTAPNAGQAGGDAAASAGAMLAGGAGAGGAGAGGAADSGGAAEGGAPDCPFVEPDCAYRQRCSDARLVPRIFVGAQQAPYAVVADADYVYWSDRNPMAPAEGRVRRRAVTGVGGIVDLARSQPDPGALALDHSHVYWVAGEQVMRAERDAVVPAGGVATPQLVSAAPGYPSGVVVDEDHVYWVGRSTGAVFGILKAVAGASAESLGPSQPKAALLAQDATRLFWTTSLGYVQTAPKAGGVTTDLVTPERLGNLLGTADLVGFEAAGIAVSADWVYARVRAVRSKPGASDTGKLLRLRKDGKELSVLVDNRLGGIAFLTLEGDNLYFTTGPSGGEVWRAGLDGGDLSLLNCQRESFPRGIAVAAGRVYWSNFAGATITWVLD